MTQHTIDDVVLEQERLEKKLDKHIEDSRVNNEQFQKRWDAVLSLQEENNKQIQNLHESTRDMVEAWQAITGAVKVGIAAGKFVKWAAGFAVLGTVVTALSDFI